MNDLLQPADPAPQAPLDKLWAVPVAAAQLRASCTRVHRHHQGIPLLPDLQFSP